MYIGIILNWKLFSAPSKAVCTHKVKQKCSAQ